MGQMMPLIIFAVMALSAGVYMIMNKKKSTNSKGNSGATQNVNAGATKGVTPTAVQEVKRNTNDVNRKDMSSFMHFDKIANDMIYQKHGSRYTMVIECKGINYELMSEMEQMAVEDGFIMFLNTLKFPVQLYVQTRSIDLTNNIRQYKERVQMFADIEREKTNKYNKLEDDIDASNEQIKDAKNEKVKYENISEYVSDITNYIEKMALNKYMLQRKFYVITSYNRSDVVTTEKFTDAEYEDICYRELYTRAQGIIASLNACSINSKVLTSNELAELIYISYNKDEHKAMNIKKSMESGFYRLYSTSEDVWQKKQEMLDQAIYEESIIRIEEAMQDAIAKGLILTPEVIEQEVDKRVDKNAIRIVENSDLSPKSKEDVKDIIIEKRRKKLKEKKEQEDKEKIARGETVQEEEVVKEEKEEPEIITKDLFTKNEEEEEQTDTVNKEKAQENKNIQDGILKNVDSSESSDDDVETIV